MAYNNFYNPYYPYPNYNQPLSQTNGIIKVNGKNGVDAFQLGPNSQALLLDETAPMVWLVQTDGAGYKTATAYDITPHQEVSTTDVIKSLEERLAKVESLLDEKSNIRSTADSNQSNRYSKQQNK